MKKTLLSILAGLTVIGSASAVPSPADRKALCEKHPEKYVWVEKTQACVPINPCKSDNSDIVYGGYCVYAFEVPDDLDKATLILQRYVQKRLKSNVANARRIDNNYFALKTTDGGYIVFETVFLRETTLRDIARAAFTIYGYNWGDGSSGEDHGGREYVLGRVGNQEICQDIADFVSLVHGEPVEWRYSDFGDMTKEYKMEEVFGYGGEDCMIEVAKKEY